MSDEERPDDPFEEFEEMDDREGDPFEAFEAPTDPASEAAVDPDEPSDPEHSASSGAQPVDELESDPLSELGPASDDPFGDFEGREGDPFGGAESVFERVDVDEIDADSVWAEITGDGEQESTTTGGRYADVSKHRYCETCEHFSEPPDVHCAHEGTEIVEFLDMETVRLLDCPVVAEQRELADEE